MNKIDDVKKLIEEKLIGINSMEELNAIKSEFLGKKGFITELQGLIKEVENDKKKEFGMKLNEVKSLFNSKYEEIKSKIEEDIINTYGAVSEECARAMARGAKNNSGSDVLVLYILLIELLKK